ncbi:Mitochodrial transcription termination factor [Parasponia andersonii]|uniref:Mitochodrial transcription termination factor n=1 Tax=Parasponia andersonii TaxID=3476 RepID=A0A2P5DVK7_PARAD|nr:Mitochodrial transcription termination factor [Parasponia andersonii]
MGLTDEDVAKTLLLEPYILLASLKDNIIPCFQVLRQVVGTKENALKVLKAGRWELKYNLKEVLEPNIFLLKSIGVPEPVILKIFVIQPRLLLLKPQQIAEIFAEVVKLGFKPNTSFFVLAFRSMSMIGKTLWEQKMETYKSFGLCEDQVYSVFKKQPLCMMNSEKKIKKMMNLFMTKLNFEPSVICTFPNLLIPSLEKRIIPRCSVLQLLMSTGLVKEGIKLFNHLTMNEEKFVEKLVRKYQQVLPDIVKAHKGKIEFKGFPIVLKM